MVRGLRSTFRRVCWVGPLPDLPPDRPVAGYFNHHSFYDGYLGWALAHFLLKRAPITWMADWEAYPFFATVGAYPFPFDDPKQRVATIRRTAQRFEDPKTFLIYFPEAELHRPEDGILPFDTAPFQRLDRLFPPKVWWPVAFHATWWGESLPTLLMAGGTPHPVSTGDEHERLTATLETARQAHRTEARTILDGHASPDERWNLSFAAPFFKRYL